MPSVRLEFNGTQAEKEKCMSATVLDSEQFPIFSKLELFNIHLMSDPEGNSKFCFPESLNVSRDEMMISNNDYPDLYFVRNNCSSKYTTNRYQIFFRYLSFCTILRGY